MHASSYESVSARRRERGGDNTSRGKRECAAGNASAFSSAVPRRIKDGGREVPRTDLPRRSFHGRSRESATSGGSSEVRIRTLAPFENLNFWSLPERRARISRWKRLCAKFMQLVAIVSGARSHVSSLVMRPSFGSVTRPPRAKYRRCVDNRRRLLLSR